MGLQKALEGLLAERCKGLLCMTHLFQVGEGVTAGIHSWLLLALPLPFLGARCRFLPCSLSPFATLFLAFIPSICFWQLVVATAKTTLHLSPQSLLM